MSFLQILHGGRAMKTHGLEVVRAGDDETWVRLPAGSTTFGRSPPGTPGGPHIEIACANLSRRAGAVIPHDGRYAVVDLKSTGGTFLRVPRALWKQKAGQPPYVLVDGTAICFGEPYGLPCAVFWESLPAAD